MKQYRYWYQD